VNYTRLAKRILILIGLISIIAAWNLKDIRFDYNFERFFPVDDPELEFLLEFREKFEPDNDFTLIAIENQAGVFKKDFLLQVDSLCNVLDDLPLVTKVTGPTRLQYPVMGPLGPISASYIHLNRPDLYQKDSIRIFSSEHLPGTFFSTTKPAISILVDSEHFISKAKCDTLAEALTKSLESFQFDSVVMSGRIIGQKYFIERTQWEMGLFIGLGFLILSIILWLSFRTTWGVWVPLLVVGLSAVWLISIMDLSGKYMDPLSTLLPIILFVVGVSDIVHILSKYLEELRWGRPKLEAIKTAFKEVGMATFLTSLTTAIGFLTLLTANVLPLREFGVFMSIGVMIAFILAFSLLPSVLILRKKPVSSQLAHTQLFWYPLMSKLFGFVLSKRKLILWLGLLVFLLSGIGISLIRIDNHLLQDLDEDDSFRKDFEYFGEHFAGIRPFEMGLFSNTEGGLLSYETALGIDSLEKYLKRELNVGFIASPLIAVKMANQATHGGKVEYYKVPRSEKEYTKLQPIIKRFKASGISRKKVVVSRIMRIPLNSSKRESR
jgi:predicted RND superfamily exporter protein